MSKVTTFIVKTVGTCNLGCNYCFASDGFHGDRMSSEMIEKVVHEIESLGLPSARFLWHGGEPLLLGIDGYKHGLQAQSECDTQFLNSVQTNGTLFNDAYCELFKEYHFTVGVSVDGYMTVQNLNRPMANGKASYGKVMNGISVLKKHEIPFTTISVVSKYTDPARFFHFIRSIGPTSFALKPCVSEWEQSVSLEEYTDFLRIIFGLWLELDDEDLISRNFMSMAENIASGQNMQSLCSTSGLCGHFATIAVNGDVFPCDELTDPQYLWGNILEQSLADILSGEARAKFLRRVAIRGKQCEETCLAYGACRGGCTACHDFYPESSYCAHLRDTAEEIRQALVAGLDETEATNDDKVALLLDPSLLSDV